MISRSVKEVMGEEIGNRVELLVTEVIASGKKQVMSYSVPIAGQTLWFEAVVSKRDEKSVVAMIRNMTDRKQMERQLEEERARQVAASRLASLGEMAGGVAPEINNPLAIIAGYAGRLMDALNAEPFFTTKPVGSGTGLGLSIAASIVREHGGDIFLVPNSSQTRFVIRLPTV